MNCKEFVRVKTNCVRCGREACSEPIHKFSSTHNMYGMPEAQAVHTIDIVMDTKLCHDCIRWIYANAKEIE